MKNTEDTLIRFSVTARLEHVAVMTLFTLLAFTGFPQKFPDTGWALWIVWLFGSVETLHLVHRVSGVLFSVLAIVHGSRASLGFLAGRIRPTMVPVRRDFQDAIQTLRYYLGLTDHHAKFDRYDYRQKFEYWGLVLGGLVMIATGLLLYFPVLATRWLPGQLIPVAKVAHSNEGLMAFLVVITWHIYNAHLAPGIFPFDTTIFTGRISRHRMEEEHPLELQRMQGASADDRGAA